MKLSTVSTIVCFTTVSLAQTARPDNVPICDFYTEALFKENTAENQAKLLTALVNRVVGGNFTATANDKPVSGILAPTDFQGEKIELLPFFTGASGATTNIGGTGTAGINFLDGGGAEPLKAGKPADNDSSRQFLLLTHLYGLFGSLTGCTKQGGAEFPNYQGNPSMFETHRFMNLNKAKLDFFNDQVGQAALSFGVTEADAKIVGGALDKLFNVKCAAPVKLTPQNEPALQSSCLADGCRVDDANSCGQGVQANGGEVQNKGEQTNNNGQNNQNQGNREVGNGVRKVIKCIPRNNGNRGGNNNEQRKAENNRNNQNNRNEEERKREEENKRREEENRNKNNRKEEQNRKNQQDNRRIEVIRENEKNRGHGNNYNKNERVVEINAERDRNNNNERKNEGHNNNGRKNEQSNNNERKKECKNGEKC